MARIRRKAAPPRPIDLNPRSEPELDFEIRPFGSLSPKDYQTLGFICGLEVHQQLDTTRKLFCHCPSAKRSSAVDAVVLRHMRPTLSELGEYDGCALMEYKTKKEIVYLLSRRTVCTYDIDDTPPFEIDPQAVRSALNLASVYNLTHASELQVMRKQYLDGSIPTGFQRTTMVAIGGEIPFRASELGPEQNIRIRQLTLEEDSCREVKDHGHRIVFRTDRLGTPLIETVTEPDFLTPEDARRGGQLIARLAQQTQLVRRGPGAARQDVNVSIAGSRRVELKGVPSHRMIPRLVHNEAMRHLSLLKIRAQLQGDGLTQASLDIDDQVDAWQTPFAIDATSLLRRIPFAPLQTALDDGHMVGAVKLPGFAKVMSTEVQPGIAFAREFEDRVRVIACLTGHPFMITSGVGDFGLGPKVWKQLRLALKTNPEDAVSVVWGPAADVDTAIRELLIRCQDALVGVPSETRQAFADGTTGFERILPGPERMYPDTDTPPIPVPEVWIDEAEKSRPEPPWALSDRSKQTGLGEADAETLGMMPWAEKFMELNIKDAKLSHTAFHALRNLGPSVDGSLLAAWAAALTRRTLPPGLAADAVKAMHNAPTEAGAILERFVRQPDDLKPSFDSAFAALPQAKKQDRDAQTRHYMGGLRHKLGAHVDPNALIPLLNQRIAS